jgi:hypothetical protein
MSMTKRKVECDGPCDSEIEIDLFSKAGQRVYHKDGYTLCIDCFHKTVCPECGPLEIGGVTVGE